MPRSVRLRSLAKINLDLRVLHKRPDGYHELRTVFQTISLADVLEIEYQPERKTSLKLDGDLNIPDNLVLRAAEAVLEAMKVRASVRFWLKKNIPMGGGLGGGSSNAAAVLLALPVLAGRNLSLEKLMELGAALGSDVPFFLEGGTAVGLGRGTEMYTLPDLKAEPILLLAPGIHVSTAQAYQALGRKLTSEDLSPKIKTPPESGISQGFQSIHGFQHYVRTLGETRSARAASQFSANDFETAVFGLYPTMKTIQGRMRKMVRDSSVREFAAVSRHAVIKQPGFVSRPGMIRMTGSGSTIFAIFDTADERDRAGESFASDSLLQQFHTMPAALVSRTRYHRLWRKQLSEHTVTEAVHDSLWPPRSRYAK